MPLAETDRVNESPRLDVRDRFNAAKLLQTDIGAWRECNHKTCKARKSCAGGPRGTATRTGGWPTCTQEGRARLRENRSPLPWEPSETYKRETPNERDFRRAERELLKLNILLKQEGIRDENLRCDE